LVIENCATTLESVRIINMTVSRVSPRRSIERSPHVDFLLSPASVKASKNSSGSTSYFAERKARYSLVEVFLFKLFHHFSRFYIFGNTDEFRKPPGSATL
jgi:hypothetical protein